MKLCLYILSLCTFTRVQMLRTHFVNCTALSASNKPICELCNKEKQHVGLCLCNTVYATVKHAYKAEPRPHLGYSDHITVMLIPPYRPLLKLAKPVQKQITVWPENATSVLQDCFQDTYWNMFKEAATYNNHTDRYLQHLAELGSHPHMSQIHDNHTVPKKSPVSCLNDYHPIALTTIIMTCFERLVMHNIKTTWILPT